MHRLNVAASTAPKLGFAAPPSDTLTLAPYPIPAAPPAPVELTVIVPTYNERANVTALIRALRKALSGLSWEVVFVDDDSPDGTARLAKKHAARDPRVRCLRRVGRRGLAGAVIEGAMASAAPYVAVIDGDLQHDEALLPSMLTLLKGGQTDLVVASRYLARGNAAEGFGKTRLAVSRLATWMGRKVLRNRVSDPVSGFFMARRGVFEAAAAKLSIDGFKVLFDLIASHPTPLRVAELPYIFRGREQGESKLDGRAVLDYLGLLAAKATHDLLSPRALLFALVGLSGLAVHLTLLRTLLGVAPGLGFGLSQLCAAVAAMTSNYLLNNHFTYRDRRKTGWALLAGYVRFCLLCGVGLGANVAVAAVLHHYAPLWWVAGAGGALFGAVWNYVTTSLAVW